MKFAAFILALCIMLISAIPEKTLAAGNQLKKDCCHKTNSSTSHQQQQKDKCNGGMCSTMLYCSSCCYLIVDAINVKPIIPVLEKSAFTSYPANNLTGYSLSCWNPPRV
jgi:hypothetical protein